MRFLRNLLANIVAIFIVLFLFFVGIVVLISMGSQQEVVVSKGSVLKLTFSQPIKEIPVDDPFSEFDFPMSNSAAALGLKDIKATLAKAKEDDNIEAIYLELSSVASGFGVLKEIRDALLDFKESGKPIFAYSEYLSESAYYLASVANRIMMSEAGIIEFNGLSVERTYYKGMFDKLGIKAQVFKVGEFKSAVEPYLSEEMSEEDRKQTEIYLNDLYDLYLVEVAESIGKTKDELETISDSMFVDNVQTALAYGLLTDITYEDEAEQLMKEVLEMEEDDKIKYVSLSKYSKVNAPNSSYSSNKIDVILAEGVIQSGASNTGSIGSETLVKQLRKARKNKSTKAIVLRVNSPGGSALASDMIWREVVLTAKEKPIIASMSDVAASGGYYIAMACDTIVALPNTITGSIGIFSVYFQLNEFMEDKLGLTFDQVNTGELSALGSPFDEFSPLEKKRIQEGVEEGYERFTSKAAQGRNMEIEALREVAGGRVWSGTKAKELGLVDELGGLSEAIEIAAEAAGVTDDYMVRYYPKKKTIFDDFLKGGFSSVKASELRKELGVLYPTYKQWKALEQLQGVQARLPYIYRIK